MEMTNLSFKSFISVDEKLTSMVVRNIETVFDDVISQKGRKC